MAEPKLKITLTNGSTGKTTTFNVLHPVTPPVVGDCRDVATTFAGLMPEGTTATSVTLTSETTVWSIS